MTTPPRILSVQADTLPQITDTERLNWLESQFTGKFRNSIFLCNEVGGEGLLMDRKMAPVLRGQTIRELIDAAMNESTQKPAPPEQIQNTTEHP